LDKGTFDLRNAIRVSDNTYFATVMQRVIDNNKFPNVDSSLSSWDNYMYAFGLGHKLGVDVPAEKGGNIPTPAYFNNPKVYGKGRWNYCNFRSVSIGQGEVSVTPLQVANEMAYIANDGSYYIPHIVDSIEGGDKYGLLTKYKKKIRPTEIPDSVFEAVHDGMQDVVDKGTGVGAKVAGIVICGKTGTVENAYRGVKQPNHSFFCGFAPRDNPKIAIMCVVENSGGHGATYAAPIVGLMIEKYLNGSITDSVRLQKLEALSKLNLMPPRIYAAIKTRDSLMHVRDSASEAARLELKMATDTLGIDDDYDDETIDRSGDTTHKNKPARNKKKATDKPQAILPDDKNKADKKNK